MWIDLSSSVGCARRNCLMQLTFGMLSVQWKMSAFENVLFRAVLPHSASWAGREADYSVSCDTRGILTPTPMEQLFLTFTDRVKLKFFQKKYLIKQLLYIQIMEQSSSIYHPHPRTWVKQLFLVDENGELFIIPFYFSCPFSIFSFLFYLVSLLISISTLSLPSFSTHRPPLSSKPTATLGCCLPPHLPA